MNYRLSTIWPRKQYTADTTEIIDIDINDPISQIVITYEPDNNPSGADATGHPVRCISKIELVDGSDVLFSLNGAEAQGVDFYHNEKEPANIMLYLTGNYSEEIINMNFGRYLYDPEMALDPKRFVNLQLKITIDIDAGGDESNDGYLTVMAHIFDEKSISPAGFLMHKEIKQYTLANASREYTDLPTDHMYKQLFIRAQRYGTGPEYQIDEIKLTEDNDKKIPLNHTMFQIIRHIVSQWRPYREWIIGPGLTAAQNMFCTPCYWPAFGGSPWRSATLTTGLVFYSGDGGRFQTAQAAAGPNWQAIVEGWAPHGLIPLLPKFGKDINDWYNVSNLGNLKLDVKGAASVGSSQTAEIILQQYRRY